VTPAIGYRSADAAPFGHPRHLHAHRHQIGCWHALCGACPCHRLSVDTARWLHSRGCRVRPSQITTMRRLERRPRAAPSRTMDRTRRSAMPANCQSVAGMSRRHVGRGQSEAERWRISMAAECRQHLPLRHDTCASGSAIPPAAKPCIPRVPHRLGESPCIPPTEVAAASARGGCAFRS